MLLAGFVFPFLISTKLMPGFFIIIAVFVVGGFSLWVAIKAVTHVAASAAKEIEDAKKDGQLCEHCCTNRKMPNDKYCLYCKYCCEVKK